MIEIYLPYSSPKKLHRKDAFFHFTQVIYPQVQSLGLSSAYLDNMMIGSTIRQMMALALVPEEHVTSLFSNLCQELDESERNELSRISKYINDD